MAPRDLLLLAAARILELTAGAPAKRLRVIVHDDCTGQEYRADGVPPAPGQDAPPAPAGYPPGVRWLTPNAEVVRAAMPVGVMLSAAKIAKLIDPQLITDQDLYAALRDMRDRGIIEGDTHGWVRPF